MINRFEVHSHTYYSNLRLIDSINQPKALIDKAIELGYSGIAITDHECLSAAMEVNQYAKQIKKDYPNFKIALGNEIYLTENRDNGQKYYHFILIAKDELGFKALKEMSTIAWDNIYTDRLLERVPLLKTELQAVMSKYKGHVIATTACIGGELSQSLLKLIECRKEKDNQKEKEVYKQIIDFIEFCQNIFGEDFYIECAPSSFKEQISVNQQLYKVAQAFGIKMVVGTDAHYLTKEERPIHTAYLNSKDGEREVDSFYHHAHLMDAEECEKLLNLSFNDLDIVHTIMNNNNLIRAKIQDYDLARKQIIPKVELPQIEKYKFFSNEYPTLKALAESDDIQERYWLHECVAGMEEKGFAEKAEYWKRLETEADIIKYIGEQLGDCLFAYFNTFKHYIDLFWECGSIVGPGRGSATGFLSNFLLGITQLDPIRWKLPYWRFLNRERVELPDIDIDLAPSKRPAIFEAIRKERGRYGLVQVATFGTEGTKSAILAACRGYRSEEYPSGIDVDDAQYMSSLIPQERGFLWDIKDVVFGNDEKGRKPVSTFIKEVDKYPGLLEIIMRISGIVNKRSSHASGVILYDDDPFKTASFMKTRSGDLITCFDLHTAEQCGDTKYDFLVTEVTDKIIQCLELLEEDKVIEKDTLRNVYNKYLHPEVLDTTDPKIWEHLEAGDILDVFQFSESSGLAIAKKCKPKSIQEMTAANAMMRLMSESGKESQQDRYVRIQHQGLEVFDEEMVQHHLPENTKTAMHKHCDEYFGCVPIQEQMMEILMDKDIAGFTLGRANAARKVVAKKKMEQIPELKAEVYEHIPNKEVADYVWEIAIAPSLGYAFSANHSTPYSFVGVQTIMLATKFNPIYWNTACLIVNSGSLEDTSSEEVIDIFEPEDDMSEGVVYVDAPDKKTKVRKIATDYGKIAKALGDIISAGIKVSLTDINKSNFSFKPDAANNQILFGLKGLLNVSDEVITDIIAKRPYSSPKDFVNKVKPKKQTMVSLIKSGAFDSMMERRKCMVWYVWETCDKKKNLTLQNMPGLIKYNLLPEETEEQIMARRIYEFNRYLKACCKIDSTKYSMTDRAIDFLAEIGHDDLIQDNYVLAKAWDKVYQKWMDVYRNWIAANKEKILDNLNTLIFMEDWKKYGGEGNLSAWEMETMCFYYHDHELKNMNTQKYGIVNFFNLSEEPLVERVIKRSGKEIPLFYLYKIAGTCIAKNKTKATVTLLTTFGVVNVKFRKEYFALFDKQISEKQPDGTKKRIEGSWFNRGEKIIVQGIRSGDNFIAKKYASTPGHTLYKITQISEDGFVELASERVGQTNV